MRRAQAEGEVPASVDPNAAAWAALAFMQSMASQMLYYPAFEDAVLHQCQWFVDAVLRH